MTLSGNTCLSRSKTMDPNMTLSGMTEPDITITLGGSAGHSLTSIWPLLAAWPTDINMPPEVMLIFMVLAVFKGLSGSLVLLQPGTVFVVCVIVRIQMKAHDPCSH